MIKGVTYDLDYPRTTHYSQIPEEVFEKDFRLMKEAGVNTIRLYGVPPEFILDLADKYDMKVIETIVFPGDWTDFTSPYQLQSLKREAIRNIKRDMDRECIYAWSIWNDAPWTYGSGRGNVIKAYGEERVSSFLRELYETVKKHDPLRPVTAATLTVDEESKRLGADFLDILGYNVYLGVTDWRNGTFEAKTCDEMVEELVSISDKYKKPVLITETGYSTYWTGAAQKDAIRDQIAKAGKELRGIILFQWADNWSKAGESAVHNDDVEEHWGLLEGTREPKGGYYAAKDMFRISLFRKRLLAIADYFRGSYFANKKRALRKRWKEAAIADKEIEGLQNSLNLKPSSKDVPVTLEELAEKFYEKKGFDQFASFLKEYRSSYPNSGYSELADYYIALSGWNKLEHLAGERMWQVYYAEKTRHLDGILGLLDRAGEKTEDKELHLKILYLDWLINDDILRGREKTALEKLEAGIKDYAISIKEPSPLIVYSRLLGEKGEDQVSERLLHEYVSRVKEFVEPKEAIALLNEEAAIGLENKNFRQAKILYDGYMNLVIRNYSKEEASSAILELANMYKQRSLLDEAIQACEKLRDEFPDSRLADDAAYILASSLKEKKSYSKAVKALHDFIIKYPNSDLSKSAIKDALSIFTIYGKRTGAQKTVSFLKEIIAIYPETDFSVMARFELASSLASLGKREEAVREYQYIIDNHPDSDYTDYSRRFIEDLRTE
jgi:TolA-binding protein